VFEAPSGRKEFQVEERDEKTAAESEIGKDPIEEEVEAHKKKNIKATPEPVTDDADDVELHRNKRLLK
jgi:hypothetical protein